MQQVPRSYIIQNPDIQYLQQPPLRYCGHFQIRTMLQHYKQHTPPLEQCCNSQFAKHIGLMHPVGFAQSLNKHGLPANFTRTPHIPVDKKLDYLKQLIFQTGPQVVMYSRLYNASGVFKNNIKRKLIYHHYVSVRGYDDEAGVFYLYDSTREKFPMSDSLPVGNFVLPYDYFLHCRKRAGVQFLRYSLIEIGNY